MQGTQFLLVRHATTDHTAQRLLCGRLDPELNEEGRQEATALAGSLMGEEFTRIVVSPAKRALETIDYISTVKAITPLIDSRLMECDFGEWEGLTFAQAQANSPAHFEQWLMDTAIAPPQGESFNAVYERAHKVVAEYSQIYAGERVLLCTHASVIRALLLDVLGVELKSHMAVNVAPASNSAITYWPDGNGEINWINRISVDLP